MNEDRNIDVWKKLAEQIDLNNLTKDDEDTIIKELKDANTQVETLKLHPRHKKLKERIMRELEL
tara:strand:- start:822 stop:1013 length:192 start_codon:yes stop_codon:yes gene_type:complete